MRVSELEAQAGGTLNALKVNDIAGALPAGSKNGELPGGKPAIAALPSPESTMRDKAMGLAKKDPVKTAQLIRSWIAADAEAAKEARRG